MKTFCMFVLALFLAGKNQQIHFTNASFEDTPGEALVPTGWTSTTPGSSPDILPGAWGVNHPPYEGKTCVGLVVRDDGTKEDLGQRLPETLEAGVCYTFTIFLAHTSQYVGHNNPCRLRIWGGQNGKKEQLLTASPLVDQEEWKSYTFQFVPNKAINYINFEAFYGPGVMIHYKGNILLDFCSSIERCDRA